MSEVGVVLMAYGTPRDRSEIAAYYTDIRRGHPPTDEQLADLTRRYDAIGGTSPLAAITESQGRALGEQLDALTPGRYQVVLGFKHTAPRIEDTVAAAGTSRLVGLVLAPHYSTASVGEYHRRAAGAADALGASYAAIDSWATEPALVEFLASDLERRLAAMPERTRVLFTAHSLPERILTTGDPYPDELRATATAVAGAAARRIAAFAEKAMRPLRSQGRGVVIYEGSPPATVSRQTSATASRTNPAPPRKAAMPAKVTAPVIPRDPPRIKAVPKVPLWLSGSRSASNGRLRKVVSSICIVVLTGRGCARRFWRSGRRHSRL